MATEYRIENGDDVIIWFKADSVKYDQDDELVRGFMNGIHIVEYCMKVNDVVYDASNYKEVCRRVE